jgi:hypothetical protein
MGLRSIMSDSLPDLFEAMGEDATFTPLTGDPVSLKAFIDFSVALEPMGFDGQSRQQRIEIEALLADLPHEPAEGETFEILSGDAQGTFEVRRVTFNDRFTVKAACKEI